MIAFINNSMETFTPTQSGALATIIWETCRAAERDGHEPLVITRRCAAPTFPWPKLILVDHPKEPTGKLGIFLARADRKIAGFRHMRQREWCEQIVSVIRDQQLQEQTLVLLNDPELVVVLRRNFPKAKIVHWFQNQLECKEKYRAAFGACADVVFGVSDFTSRWIENYYRLPANSVKTLYNAVDSEFFTPGDEAPNGAPVINFVGRTGIEKAPDLLLKAANRLADEGCRFSVQIIGSNHWDRFELDGYQRELIALIDELQKKGITVRRTGHVGRPSLPAELRKAHIHVMPSRWDEPFGMATIEGMACGLATVASRTGGTPEILEGHGKLFARDSVEELAGVLKELIVDGELRQTLAGKARDRAQELNWGRTPS